MRTPVYKRVNGLLAVAFISAGLGLAATPALAEYDEAKCKSAIQKLKKHLQEHKTLKVKDFFDEVDDLDKAPQPVSEDQYKEIFDMPFDDMTWVKKYQGYRDDVKENCVQ